MHDQRLHVLLRGKHAAGGAKGLGRVDGHRGRSAVLDHSNGPNDERVRLVVGPEPWSSSKFFLGDDTYATVISNTSGCLIACVYFHSYEKKFFSFLD